MVSRLRRDMDGQRVSGEVVEVFQVISGERSNVDEWRSNWSALDASRLRILSLQLAASTYRNITTDR